jgi:Uncharacterised nucleotidyltransferase
MYGVPLFDVVSTILPSDTATCLLQSALWKGPAAQVAWDAWQRSVGSAADFLKADRFGFKRLLPLLQHNLQKEEVVVSPEVSSILRSARAREELRYASFRRFGGDGIRSLTAAGIEIIVLKGAASAAIYYPHPAIRHCHDIDVLVHRGLEKDIASASAAAGFRCSEIATEPGGVRMTHPSGLPIECHISLSKVPYYPVADDAIWNRAQSAEVLGVSCRIPAVTDMLAHLCAHTLWNPRRQSMNWVTDAYLLLESGEFHWRSFLDTIHQWQIDLPAFVILGYLNQVLHSPVPEFALAELKEGAARTDGLRKQVAIRGVRSSGSKGFRELFRSAGWSSRYAILRCLFLQ